MFRLIFSRQFKRRQPTGAGEKPVMIVLNIAGFKDFVKSCTVEGNKNVSGDFLLPIKATTSRWGWHKSYHEYYKPSMI
jgi:hypothetical protein